MVDLGFVWILKDKSMQIQIDFAWTGGWMDGKHLKRNWERKMAGNSSGTGMREAVSVP